MHDPGPGDIDLGAAMAGALPILRRSWAPRMIRHS